MNSRQFFHVLILSILLIVSLRAKPQAAEAEKRPALHRWAIIADAPAGKLSLADLLTVELSDSPDVQLVERERIAEVFKELELAALLGSADVAKRLELGRTLGADALVLLSTSEQDEGQFLKLTVVECEYGARLQTQFTPLAKQQPDDLAAWAAEHVDDVRQRFPRGIQQIIGVTPFASKNLTHDFDHLQVGFSLLLENALLTQSGVAVVEFTEVHAIRRELNLTTREIQRRTEPILLEGVFRTQRDGETTTFDVGVQVAAGKAEDQRLAKLGVSLDKANRWLTDELPRRVLKISGEQPGLDRATQVRLLRQRADMFASVGQWSSSVGLREAALLLATDDFALRVNVINELRRWRLSVRSQKSRIYDVRNSSEPREFTRFDRGQQQQWMELHRQQWDNWNRLTWQVEQAIRARQVNIREAEFLIGHILSLPYTMLTPNFSNYAELRAAQQDFWWRAYSQLRHLDGTIGDGTIRPAWLLPREPTVKLRPFDHGEPPLLQWEWATRGAMQHLLVAHALGTELQQVADQWDHLNPHYSASIFEAEAFVRDLDRYLSAFADTELALANPSSRRWLYEPLQQIVEKNRRQSNGKQGEALLHELFTVRDRYSQFASASALVRNNLIRFTPPKPYVPKIKRTDPSPLRDRNSKLPHPLNADSPWWKVTSPAQLPEEEQLAQHLIAPAMNLGRISLSKIDEPKSVLLRLRGPLLRCTDNLDLWWSLTAVRIMRKKGQMETIFEWNETTGAVMSAAYDGENFWIRCREGSVFVISPEGKRITEFNTDNGLPPFDKQELASVPGYRPFDRLQPLGPGRCVAIGYFGEHRRVWAAVLETAAASGEARKDRVEVFYQATKVQPVDQPDAANSDLDIITELGRVYNYRTPAGKRLLYIARRANARIGGNLRPLVIDLSGKPQVSVAETDPPWTEGSVRGRPTVMLPDGRVLATNAAGGVSLFTPAAQLRNWQEEKIIDGPTEEEWRWSQSSKNKVSYTLARDGEWIYFGGLFWYRIDPQTLAVERLTDQPLTSGVSSIQASAHYGLLGTERRPVTVTLDQPPTDEALQQAYGWIKPEQCRGHHQAAQEISRLGGFVGQTQRWSRGGNNIMTREPYRGGASSTTVLLPAAWQGGDEALPLLKQLGKVQRVYVFTEAVTDAGLKHLAELPDLRALYLDGPQVSAAGLRHFQAGSLTDLRLVAAADSPNPGDDCLAAVAQFSRLSKLGLVGSSFSDQGLQHFREPTRSLLIMALDTSISAKLAEELSEQRSLFVKRVSP